MTSMFSIGITSTVYISNCGSSIVTSSGSQINSGITKLSGTSIDIVSISSNISSKLSSKSSIIVVTSSISS